MLSIKYRFVALVFIRPAQEITVQAIGHNLYCKGDEYDKQRNNKIENISIRIWPDDKRVITGTDILGRLLRGITHRD